MPTAAQGVDLFFNSFRADLELPTAWAGSALAKFTLGSRGVWPPGHLTKTEAGQIAISYVRQTQLWFSACGMVGLLLPGLLTGLRASRSPPSRERGKAAVRCVRDRCRTPSRAA